MRGGPRKRKHTVHDWWFRVVPGMPLAFWLRVSKELKARRLPLSSRSSVELVALDILKHWRRT